MLSRLRMLRSPCVRGAPRVWSTVLGSATPRRLAFTTRHLSSNAASDSVSSVLTGASVKPPSASTDIGIPSHTRVSTFPSAVLPSSTDGGLPVEVSLLAQLGHGAGSHLYESVTRRQRAHQAFVDELDEPSTQIAAPDFARGDSTALYTFSVGPRGHPFHRHAGHRVFLAVSGSSGAQLRFSSASSEALAADPSLFVRQLRHVEIPPDCMFSVRFSGETWHQFAPLDPRAGQPAFFALSCHTNELGGELSDELRARVRAGGASIPALTELLPANVQSMLNSMPRSSMHVPTITLSLDAPASTVHSAACSVTRVNVGRVRGVWGRWWPSGGFTSHRGGRHTVQARPQPHRDSLIRGQLQESVDHEDSFHISIGADEIKAALARVGSQSSDSAAPTAKDLLAAVLHGFLHNPPSGVSKLMAFRNALVRPLGLRTSPLGCPVSSLLGGRRDDGSLFAGRFPVLAQRVSGDGSSAEVILGGDDKHLRFRSCIAVRVEEDESAAGSEGGAAVGASSRNVSPLRFDVSMSTRVQCRNLFGRAYMRAIDRTHRSYVSPTMLRMAVEHAIGEGLREMQQQQQQPGVCGPTKTEETGEAAQGSVTL